MDDSKKTLIEEFLIESFDNIANCTNQLTTLEKEPNNDELLNNIYREIHTLKGSASFLGYEKVSDVAHINESLLDGIREKKFKLNQDITDVLLEGFDLCSSCLQSIKDKGDESNIHTQNYMVNAYRLIEKLLGPENIMEMGFSSTIHDAVLEAKKEGKANEEGQASSNSQTKNESTSPMTEEKKNLEQPKEPTATQSVKDKSDSQVKDALTLKKQEVEKATEKSAKTKKETSDSTEPKSTASKNTDNLVDSVVRVNVRLLDKIMNVVGELVLNRNQLIQLSTTLNAPEFTKLTQQLNAITTELQNDIMVTRMQPVGSVLGKFQRVIRDLAREQKKNVRFEISGQETELDKTILDAIKDPLTHLVRNAVDHGMDTPEERLEKGKSETGYIAINAYHEAGQVTIEIVDDGRGINPDKIKAKAIEKGLITRDEAASLTNEKTYQLIFKPGFSTAEKVTNISGRGVGMDVVRTNIENVGGTIDILSQIDSGSTFKLNIPLTLAIIQALIISVDKHSFAIPQANVMELVRLEDEQGIELLHGAEFFRLRGTLIPIFRLSDILEINKSDDTLTTKESSLETEEDLETEESQVRESDNENTSQLNQDQDNTPESNREEEIQKQNERLLEKKAYLNQGQETQKRSTPKNKNEGQLSDSDEKNEETNLIILNTGDKTYGLVVDTVLDTQEIVVRPLDSFFTKQYFYAGATIKGDGSVAMIVDVKGIYTKATIIEGEKSIGTAQQENDLNSEESNAGKKSEFFLFSLGDGRQFAIPLPLIHRLEVFESTKIEWTSSTPVIRYLEKPMPIIDLKKVLNIQHDQTKLARDNKEPYKVEAFIMDILGQHLAFAVDKILDIVSTSSELSSELSDKSGVWGTIYLEERMITVLDVYSIAAGLNIKKNIKRPTLKKQKKVLLVDDSKFHRCATGEILQAMDIKYEEAENGKEAFRLFESDNFDLVITDLIMPEMDGWELAQKIKEQSDSPILAITGKTSTSDKTNHSENFTKFINKYRQDDVVSAIIELLDDSQLANGKTKENVA